MNHTLSRMVKLSIEDRTNDEHFLKINRLGAGAFGLVELCIVQEDKVYAKKGEKVAIKRMKNVSNMIALKESKVLQKLDYPHIVRYMDCFKDVKGHFCIVMEYCDHGTLEEYLTSFVVKPFPEFGIWRLIAQLSQALAFMHGQQPSILHNDLKPANILCKNEPSEGVRGAIVLKIADFGVSSVLGETPAALYYKAQPAGGVCYLAPEILRGDDQDPTTSADVWSMGALIAFMANDREHLFKTERDVFRWSGDATPLKRNFKYPQLHQLVLELLSKDKDLRPSAAEIVREIFKEEHEGRQYCHEDDLD